MKNKKLKLDELKVQSFVTGIENEKQTIHGGGPTPGAGDDTVGLDCEQQDLGGPWCTVGGQEACAA